MKLVMLLADGFEDVEAIATLDVLKRAGFEVETASCTGSPMVKSKYFGSMFADNLAGFQIAGDFDGLIIPGGPASINFLPDFPLTSQMIQDFIWEKKLVAAICAAPHILGKLGYLNGKNFTVHPGFEQYCTGGNYLRDQGVVRDGNIITAKSMYYSIEFALEIVKYFKGEEFAEEVRKGLQGEGR